MKPQKRSNGQARRGTRVADERRTTVRLCFQKQVVVLQNTPFHQKRVFCNASPWLSKRGGVLCVFLPISRGMIRWAGYTPQYWGNVPISKELPSALVYIIPNTRWLLTVGALSIHAGMIPGGLYAILGGPKWARILYVCTYTVSNFIVPYSL